MTDTRLGDIETVIGRLPRRQGIVFRHHDASDRRALFERVRRIARRRGHVLLVAATPRTARAWGADGAHDRSAMRSIGLRTSAVHDRAELVTAAHADLIFVSPVFATRSHPGARTLGAVRLGLLIGKDRRKTIVLGGINARSFRQLRALGVYGWAAIDAFRT